MPWPMNLGMILACFGGLFFATWPCFADISEGKSPLSPEKGQGLFLGRGRAYFFTSFWISRSVSDGLPKSFEFFLCPSVNHFWGQEGFGNDAEAKGSVQF